MNTSRVFLEALFCNKPNDFYILIWTLQGEQKKSRWFRDIGRAGVYVNSLRGCNVYVGIGLSPSDFGEINRCKSEDVAGTCRFQVPQRSFPSWVSTPGSTEFRKFGRA